MLAGELSKPRNKGKAILEMNPTPASMIDQRVCRAISLCYVQMRPRISSTWTSRWRVPAFATSNFERSCMQDEHAHYEVAWKKAFENCLAGDCRRCFGVVSSFRCFCKLFIVFFFFGDLAVQNRIASSSRRSWVRRRP